jgi:hypothetical protein
MTIITKLLFLYLAFLIPAGMAASISLAIQSEGTTAKQLAALQKALPDVLILTQAKESPASAWTSTIAAQFHFPKTGNGKNSSPLLLVRNDSPWETIKPIQIEGIAHGNGILLAPKGAAPGTMVFPLLVLDQASKEIEARIHRWTKNVISADPQTPIIIIGPFKESPPDSFSTTQVGEWRIWTNIAQIQRKNQLLILGGN